MAIFTHQDCDGDSVEILADSDDPQEDLVALFRNRTGDVAGGVRIDRDTVLRLYAVLGEYLFPASTPEYANRSLIEQMIEKAVKDQVTAILPLHLTPFATQMQATEDKIGRVANALMADPEPHDVGHAEEPEPRLCGACMSGNHPHIFLPCPQAACQCPEWALKQHAEPEQDHGRLMSELPRRAPRCTECMHSWAEHTSGVCWGRAVLKDRTAECGCSCTRERP